MNAATTADLVLAAVSISPSCFDRDEDDDPRFICDVIERAHMLSPEAVLATLFKLRDAGRVELSRADLVTSMDTSKVGRSEITLEGVEKLHLVLPV